MFITKAKSGTSDKVQVYLTRSYRDANGKPRQERIKHYGELSALKKEDPDIENKLNDEAKRLTKEKRQEELVSITIDFGEKITDYTSCGIKNYGWFFLDQIYDELGITSLINDYSKDKKFKYSIDKILRYISYMRIINPSSKHAMLTDIDKVFGSFDFSLDDTYHALDDLEQIKEEIQYSIHKSITKRYTRECKFVFYDVTNYYKSADIASNCFDDVLNEISENNLMQYGFSKERVRRPIVQMGLFMDSNGIPICYRLFKGNIPDVKTFAPFIEQIKKKYGFEKVICVADKAMNSKDNIELLIENDDSYLFSQKIRGKVDKKLQDFAFSNKGWKWNKTKTFKTKSMIRNRIINGKNFSEKVLAVYSVACAKRQQHQREELIEKAKKALKNQNELRRIDKVSAKLPLKKISNSQVYYEIDEDRILDLKKWEGLNMIVTNETNMNNWEILEQYHELWQIEETFKITKSDLEARPMYHRLDSRIQGHFLSCFISLVILRLLQTKTNHLLTKDKIINGIKEMNCAKIEGRIYLNLATKSAIELAKLLKKDISFRKTTVEKIRALK